MARRARLLVAGCPHHLWWGGHNGQPVFVDATDRQAFLDLLAAESARLGLPVHAYALLDAEVHLLATPADAPVLSALMQSLGRAYVRRYNLRHGRRGTLWDGRFRASALQADRYLLAVMAWMDGLPVRQGEVTAMAQAPWTSHAHYIGLRRDRWLVPPPAWWALGNTPFAREAAYAERAAQALPPVQARAMESALRGGWPLGEADFLAALQAATAVPVAPRRAGRPRRRLA